MAKLKEYRVGIFEEQGGYIIVKAKDKVEAREKATTFVEMKGINGKVDVTHRDTYIVDNPVEYK